MALHESPPFRHLIDLESKALVRSLAFSPSGQLLAVGKEDRTIVLYRLSDWEIIQKIKTEKVIDTLRWNSEGTLLAVGGFASETIIFNTANWSRFRTFPALLGARSLSWHPSQPYLALSHFPLYDKSVAIIATTTWNIQTLSLSYLATELSFAPSHRLLAVGKACEGIDILTINDYKRFVFLDFSDCLSDEPAEITSPSWSHDGRFLAASSSDGRVRVWSTNDWSISTTLQLFESWDEAVYSCQFSPDNKYLLCGGFGVPKIIAVKNWLVLQSLGATPSEDSLSLAWHPSSSFFALSGRASKVIEIWRKR